MDESMIEKVATAIELCDKPYSSEHLARAAIEAMKWPSKRMVDVAWEKLRGNLRPDEYYRHMIEAALNEPQEPAHDPR